MSKFVDFELTVSRIFGVTMLVLTLSKRIKSSDGEERWWVFNCLCCKSRGVGGLLPFGLINMGPVF